MTNHLRHAAAAGATLRMFKVTAKTPQLVSTRRQAKKALQAQGLSGRQIRKLRKQARREERVRRDA